MSEECRVQIPAGIKIIVIDCGFIRWMMCGVAQCTVCVWLFLNRWTVDGYTEDMNHHYMMMIMFFSVVIARVG